MNLSECRKAVTAAVAIALIILKTYYGWVLPGIDLPIVDLIMWMLGVAAVYLVPNKKPA